MALIYAKTIVSTKAELLYVSMNLLELRDIVDVFLICESNVSHAGEFVGHHLRDYFISNLNSTKVRFLEMDITLAARKWQGDADDLHYNEQLIRNGFVYHVDLHPDDIVISMDADEVLFKNRIKVLVRRLQRRLQNRESYVLRLNQVIYRLSYKWVDCDFRGPVVAKAGYFLRKSSPQWRYEGFPTFRKSGTHFTWMMNAEDMVRKIKRYSHRVENEKYASVELLSQAVSNRTYPFEPDRPFTIKISRSFEEKYYPKSLLAHLQDFPESLT